MYLLFYVGLLSILIRQTNVIWVIFLAMERIVDLLHQHMRKPIKFTAINTPIHLKVSKNIVFESKHITFLYNFYEQRMIRLCTF